jgi:DNA-binding LacI/PurR family transcriptional regulator
VNSPHQTGKTRRIAISIDLDWGFKHHTEVFAGCQRYADEAGWQSSLHPAPERVILAHGGKNPGFDGIIARATPALAKAAARAGIPLVNVWLNSPARHLPSTFVDYEAAGAMAAEHLLGRGFRHFGFLGYLREIDSRLLLNGYQSVIQEAGYDCNIHRFPPNQHHGERPRLGHLRFRPEKVDRYLADPHRHFRDPRPPLPPPDRCFPFKRPPCFPERGHRRHQQRNRHL